jgi:hypothetical protein
MGYAARHVASSGGLLLCRRELFERLGGSAKT